MKEEIIMQHSVETVKLLSKTQYNVFSHKKRLTLFFLSAVLILMGFGLIYDVGRPWRYILMAVGAIMIPNIGASAQIKVDKTLSAIERQGGKFPRTKMVFYEKGVKITEDASSSHTLKYKEVLKAVEDSNYFYLFITNESAYMIPKNQLKDVDAFRELMNKETNGGITNSQSSLLSLRFNDKSYLKGLKKLKSK